jgi:hypothetical protein
MVSIEVEMKIGNWIISEWEMLIILSIVFFIKYSVSNIIFSIINIYNQII